MPRIVRNELVSRAVSEALRQRGLSHKQVGELLNLKTQTVDNKVSDGHFSNRIAQKWSEALNIPIEVFLAGEEPLPPNQYQAIINEINTLKHEINMLKTRMDELENHAEQYNR